MSKFVKPKSKDQHRIRLRSDDDNGEILLVLGRKRAYIWVSAYSGEIMTFSGAKTLRRLAKEILSEIPDAKGQKC